jgi:hypothetical protein
MGQDTTGLSRTQFVVHHVHEFAHVFYFFDFGRMKPDPEMSLDGHYDIDVIERIPSLDILRRGRHVDRKIRQIEYFADYTRDFGENLISIHGHRSWW